MQLPVLSQRPPQQPEVARFLAALQDRGFAGEIDSRFATRLSAATDNSIYQLLPEAVVFPRSRADVVCLAKLLGEPQHRAVTATARGGGTGTNGQALCTGIVVDLSRHLDRIGRIDPEGGFVEVEPGVVLDDLNRELLPHGSWFAPTLSPSNRATLGGMISTNACGKGSRVYGRTADHVRELELVLVGGETLRFEEMDLAEARRLAQRSDRLGDLHRTVLGLVTEHAQEIERVWPKMPRSLTGYDLRGVLSSPGRFSLIPILAGSEGTLGFVVGAKLNLTRLPAHRRLVALVYDEFHKALASAEALLATDPVAIETIDGTILKLARRDSIWQKVAPFLQDLPEFQALNLVEFAGDDPAALDAKVGLLLGAPESTDAAARPLAARAAPDAATAASLWELRKKGVGLLGAMPGDRRPLAFVEDTAVPPRELSAYIAEFRALLDQLGLAYGMFGHVDAGCLHVRPALDLRTDADAARIRWLTERVVELVQRHGGVLWGEHGKGFRSEYSPRFFGPILFSALCRVKEAFDPQGQLNPGKLAVVPGRNQELSTLDAPLRGQFDRQIPASSQRHFEPAIHCNGNGQCFSTDPQSVMCPSSKWTRDRVHSPKGRAVLLREWLRQLGLLGFDPGARLARGELPAEGGAATWLERQVLGRREQDDYDFSHEVRDALDGCLSCKACSTQCPIHVDIPRMRAEFLAFYHERYRRPVGDYLLAGLEWMLAAASHMVPLYNFLLERPAIRWFLRRGLGMVDVPRLAWPTLSQRLAQRRAERFDLSSLWRDSPAKLHKTVLVLQDAFTSFFNPEVVLATLDVISNLGYRPLLLPFFPNGKGLHVKGFLRAFRHLAEHNARWLGQVAELGVPLVGIEPAVTLTYRDEYKEVLGPQNVHFEVELLQQWLARHRNELKESVRVREISAEPFHLLGHCTETTAEPGAAKDWQEVFAAVGLTLRPEPLGCCGMCGVFGHEATHAEESKGIYALSWQPVVKAQAHPERLLAPGYSCRSQTQRVDGIVLRHPIQVVREQLEQR